MINLEDPCLNHKDKFNKMMEEWEREGGRINPALLRKWSDGYEKWLNEIDIYKNKDTCPKNRVPSDTYFVVDGEKLIGAVSIRHYLNDELMLAGGHIAYGIRPSARRQGSAKKALALALDKCRSMGMDKVLITCNKDNIGSAKTIIANDGVLENEFINEEGVIEQRYWISL